MYFRLTPLELAALRSGQTVTFTQEPESGELPLPADLARGVLECLREVHLIRRDDRYDFAPGSQHGPNRSPVAGIPLTTIPEARAGVRLSLNRSGESELGRLTLDGSSRFSTGAGSPGGGLSAGPYAVGMSRAVLDPGNAAANARLAHDPALQGKVTVEVDGRRQAAAGFPAKTTTPIAGTPSAASKI